MIDFLKKFFGQSTSSSTAKDRLRLVLMTDHLALAPELVEQMKRDLIAVISRYVEVDQDKVEVNFEREDKALAMLASIPIVSVNRPKSGGEGTTTERPTPAEPVAVAVARTEPEAPAAPPKRRRRKKPQNPNAPKPVTAH